MKVIIGVVFALVLLAASKATSIWLRFNVGCGSSEHLSWPFRSAYDESVDLSKVRKKIADAGLQDRDLTNFDAIRVRGHLLTLRLLGNKRFDGGGVIGYGANVEDDLASIWSAVYKNDHPHGLYSDLTVIAIVDPSGFNLKSITGPGCLPIL